MKKLTQEEMLKVNGGGVIDGFFTHSVEVNKGEDERMKEYYHDHPRHAGSQHYHEPSDHGTRQDRD